MGPDENIATLRSRVSALVEQEGVLLTQAFELSRTEAERHRIDELFAKVQAIQIQRNVIRKRIGDMLGTHRLHAPSEVWQEGAYDYRRDVGGDAVRVRVVKGPLGLQVVLPGKGPVRIETVKGTFDGPLAAEA
ncbi:hypothetical protein [Ramlibacter sp.]|uniref:hypothetical protein n=1 Tax=Ramlibacter sp. TaxID=1917967 RepID=UPI003D0CF9A4